MKKIFKRGLSFLMATVMLIGCLGNGMSLKSYATEVAAQELDYIVTAETLQELVAEIRQKKDGGGIYCGVMDSEYGYCS